MQIMSERRESTRCEVHTIRIETICNDIVDSRGLYRRKNQTDHLCFSSCALVGRVEGWSQDYGIVAFDIRSALRNLSSLA